jgi:teichuronic acid biosynthesis glycosyltransferase TuaG
MSNPLVSVIIPFYKRKEWLEEALESVFMQTYKNYEVILINDGSEEDISDIVNSYLNNIRYFYQSNKGAASARNTGISLAKGDYYAFLDSDDIWLPQKLEVQISKMIEVNSLWSHSSYLKFNDTGFVSEINVSPYEGKVFPISIISNPIATPTVIINKKIFEDNPNILFEESLTYGEDTILWMLISMNYVLLAVEEVLVKVRLRGTNSSMLAYSQITGRARIWEWLKKNQPFNLSRTLKFHTRMAYKYCYLLNRLFQKNTHIFRNEKILKCLFLLPWMVFKVDKIFFYYCKRRR